jgi:hypothetical protein
LQGGTLAAATTRPYTTAIPDDIKADIASVVHGVRVAVFPISSFQLVWSFLIEVRDVRSLSQAFTQ